MQSRWRPEFLQVHSRLNRQAVLKLHVSVEMRGILPAARPCLGSVYQI